VTDLRARSSAGEYKSDRLLQRSIPLLKIQNPLSQSRRRETKGKLKMRTKIPKVSIFLIVAILATLSSVSSVDDKCAACNVVAVTTPSSLPYIDRSCYCSLLKFSASQSPVLDLSEICLEIVLP